MDSTRHKQSFGITKKNQSDGLQGQSVSIKLNCRRSKLVPVVADDGQLFVNTNSEHDKILKNILILTTARRSTNNEIK